MQPQLLPSGKNRKENRKRNRHILHCRLPWDLIIQFPLPLLWPKKREKPVRIDSWKRVFWTEVEFHLCTSLLIFWSNRCQNEDVITREVWSVTADFAFEMSGNHFWEVESAWTTVFVFFVFFLGGQGFFFLVGLRGRGIALGRTPFSQRVYTSVEPSWF